ncbi:MAG: hypothetical protein UT53_C0035G0006 [Candidatus Yanofskybacteria bacterium GW2011_GWD2_39_48]|uniref:DUF11 domain-containing protein n=1 Tax=Candidatus Yanofskybacteria bacterium GW2011_GWD2_39_48 TaxID=1619031 RepID=A0A0G0RJK5_9BACT|nr:MAG: hypothetical protein UT53_C0035G0006 [Candidatus Yanofskybacteria bacterium GW2011_GWD2_39_48]
MALNGSKSVSPTYTRTYHLTAYNESRDVTIDVRDNCNSGTNSISISKTVRNLSSGNSYDSETVNANTGDQVEFTIRVGTNSNYNNSINNLRVYDDLPSGLRYISGSTTVDGSYYGDGLVSGGINLGYRNGNYGTIVVKFRASVDNIGYYQYGTSTLINTARATADNTNSVSDTASVYIFRGNTNPTGNLDIQKFVRNTSRGETVERISTTASPNNTIEFILHVRNNSSTAAYNVNVYDPLPNGLTYVISSTGLNGYAVGDGVTNNGINIGTLNQNQEAIIKFFAIVNSGSVNQTITNIAQAKADNVLTIYSSPALVTIGNGIVAGALTIKTGASSTATLPLIGAMIATGLYFYSRRKQVKKELNFIRN